jgi:hypothetical protein
MSKKKVKWLCSGWGVFPDGTKCKGCDDCNGTKIPKTKKEIERHFSKTHSRLSIKKVKRNNERKTH